MQVWEIQGSFLIVSRTEEDMRSIYMDRHGESIGSRSYRLCSPGELIDVTNGCDGSVKKTAREFAEHAGRGYVPVYIACSRSIRVDDDYQKTSDRTDMVSIEVGRKYTLGRYKCPDAKEVVVTSIDDARAWYDDHQEGGWWDRKCVSFKYTTGESDEMCESFEYAQDYWAEVKETIMCRLRRLRWKLKRRNLM